MSVVLTAPSAFPAGTSVAAYPRSAWPTVPDPPSGAPAGSATETQTVQPDRTLTFTALVAATQYYLYASVGGRDRIVRVRAGATSGPQPEFAEGFTDGQVPAYEAATDRFVATAAGGAPSGAAGGDLTGTFPNPTIGALKVTDAKVAAANKDGAAGTASMRTLGTGAAQAAAGNDSRITGAIAASIVDAKGDIIAATAADTVSRLAVGSNGTRLEADNTQATGLKWGTPLTLATDTLWDTKGDIVVATAADTAAKLAVGANDTFLVADSSATPGVAWKVANQKSKLWRPSGISGTAQSAIIDENFSRSDFGGTAASQTTGTLRLHGGCVIPAGKTCAKAVVYFVTTGTTLTHTWAVLVDQTGAILAITADDTSASFTAVAFKTFTWTSAYVAVADIAVYVGLLFAGTTSPQLPVKTAQNIGGMAPFIGATSSTGLTDPASLGAGPVSVSTSNSSPTWVVLA